MIKILKRLENNAPHFYLDQKHREQIVYVANLNFSVIVCDTAWHLYTTQLSNQLWITRVTNNEV